MYWRPSPSFARAADCPLERDFPDVTSAPVATRIWWDNVHLSSRMGCERARLTSNDIANFLFSASIKTSNSSKHRKGLFTFPQIARMRHRVVKDVSPPDNARASFAMPSVDSATISVETYSDVTTI